MGTRPQSARKRGTVRTSSAPGPGRRILTGFLIGSALFGIVFGLQWMQSSLNEKAPASKTRTSVKPAPEADAPKTAGKAEAAEKPTPTDGWKSSSSGKPSILPDGVSPWQISLTLGGVIVGIVCMAIGLRHLMRKGRIAPGRERVLSLLDALPIGPKRFVYVVDLKGRTLVIGAGGERVTLLAEYGEDEWPPPLNAEAAAEAPARMPAPAPEPAHEPKQPERPQVARKKIAAGTSLDKALAAYENTVETRPRPAPKERPAGAHRVPEAFRHLLDRAVEEGRDA